MRTEEQHRERKNEIMKKCFDCLSENGLAETSVRKLAKAAGISAGNIYTYFDSVDDLIIETTNYCAQLIDDDFLKILPNNFENLKEELLNVDYSKLKRNSKRYRFVMNVYIYRLSTTIHALSYLNELTSVMTITQNRSSRRLGFLTR